MDYIIMSREESTCNNFIDYVNSFYSLDNTPMTLQNTYSNPGYLVDLGF